MSPRASSTASRAPSAGSTRRRRPTAPGAKTSARPRKGAKGAKTATAARSAKRRAATSANKRATTPTDEATAARLRVVQGRATSKSGKSGKTNNANNANNTIKAARARRPDALTTEAKVLFAAVVGLCLFGLPIVLSASAPESVLAGGSPWSYFIRQSIYMAIGVSAAVVASFVPIERVRSLRFALPAVAFALLVIVFLPGIGHYAGGSSRWIGLGPIQLQPSELMKLALVIFAADLLARRAKRSDEWHAVVRPLLVVLAVAAILIVKQPDLGTAIVLCCITFSMLFAAGVRLRLLSTAGLAIALAGGVVALGASYRRDRLLSFLDPFQHASTTGYQVVQSLATLGLGGLTGSGVGGSATPWGFLPNAHTDFVFAVIAGNLGLVGAVAVLAGFAAFGWAGLRIAAREADPFARYLAVGITCWILAQAVINVGGVVDALPVTGIPLPFISYGGSALGIVLVASGLLFGIARRQSIARPAATQPTRRRPSEAQPAPQRRSGMGSA